MKKAALLFTLLAIVALSSCGKEEDIKDQKDYDKTEKENIEEVPFCEWNEAIEASGPDIQKIVVKELEYSEDCGCYLSGMEKFIENGKTKYLITYESKDCVGYGYKITCEDGNCYKKGQKCKFLQDCSGN